MNPPMSETTTMQSDLPSCDNEPIHAPGSIQPFGVLLAFDPNTLMVRHASENSREVFGLGATELLGSTAAELLGAAAETALRDALARDGLIDASSDSRLGPRQGRRDGGTESPIAWAAWCSSNWSQPTKRPRPRSTLLAAVRVSVGRLSAAATISEFCATVAREVRSLTGYDRVMVYRFDAEWNGEVVAEERRADLEAYPWASLSRFRHTRPGPSLVPGQPHPGDPRRCLRADPGGSRPRRPHGVAPGPESLPAAQRFAHPPGIPAQHGGAGHR